MKKRFLKALLILLTLLGAVALLLIASHGKALRVEREVLKPILSTAMSYERVERLGAFDPWTSILPYWTITYSEVPIDVGFDTPSISVNLFGQVVDWRSKEVAMKLAENGYTDDY
ncbi:MAG: hypothetical protein R3F19_31920 [Verrucomicrobiales bacterium]